MIDTLIEIITKISHDLTDYGKVNAIINKNYIIKII